MTLTWGQMFNLTFRGHVIHHSMRLDELRTMACESFLYLCWIKSYYRKTIRNENEHFFFGDLWWPSFWPVRKNERSSFFTDFDRSFERRLPLVSTTLRSRVRRGGVKPPLPPARCVTDGAPARRGLKPVWRLDRRWTSGRGGTIVWKRRARAHVQMHPTSDLCKPLI